MLKQEMNIQKTNRLLGHGDKEFMRTATRELMRTNNRELGWILKCSALKQCLHCAKARQIKKLEPL
jgi:hypothetical protein